MPSTSNRAAIDDSKRTFTISELSEHFEKAHRQRTEELRASQSTSQDADEFPAYGSLAVPPAELLTPKPQILVGAGTPLACTSCHRVGMAAYYLKRSNGLYAVLCFDSGKGCWEHSSRSLCSYSDPDGAQCSDLAEFSVIYGYETDLTARALCARHVATGLSNARSYRVVPLDKD